MSERLDNKEVESQPISQEEYSRFQSATLQFCKARSPACFCPLPSRFSAGNIRQEILEIPDWPFQQATVPPPSSLFFSFLFSGITQFGYWPLYAQSTCVRNIQRQGFLTGPPLRSLNVLESLGMLFGCLLCHLIIRTRSPRVSVARRGTGRE